VPTLVWLCRSGVTADWSWDVISRVEAIGDYSHGRGLKLHHANRIGLAVRFIKLRTIC
jgi:hypothetical protein